MEAGKFQFLPLILANNRLCDIARTDATCAYSDCAHRSIWKLMPDILEIGRKATFCLYIGVTDQIAHLWFFTAEIAFFTHFINPLLF